ncbi:MAG TPA: addiction module antidote protein [Terracidiphilus sp.]|jgi:probable addiction module antidote protein|nr:addiction module antidote protein [Terracidiphilus sp.]
MKKNLKASASFHDWEIRELRKDREFALELLRAALESLEDPEERGGGLLSLRALAEAYGGLAKVAAQAGISRESLYRSLSPKGNPTLKTLIAVVNAVGLRLTVVEAKRVKRPKARDVRIAA